ncbi:LOW QUALITY PROTEIN: hypothetical protein MAR_030917 [Mya arenaria]|uniref:Uncharacterized protein n=1 Tax=Mya arenaria TaxID=6604 RepID=A0ABY7F2B5_MYAAR|nr:LOW QUALITY PROTEIN: hypothetical protein MAR_030917 [Mya arenaria]
MQLNSTKRFWKLIRRRRCNVNRLGAGINFNGYFVIAYNLRKNRAITLKNYIRLLIKQNLTESGMNMSPRKLNKNFEVCIRNCLSPPYRHGYFRMSIGEGIRTGQHLL